MSNPGKRKNDFIDLTSDDENVHRQHKRVNQRSSQPSASQSFNSGSQTVRDLWSVGNDEGNDIIDLSQDVDEGNGWVCVGVIDVKIVGVRYYNGYATVDEQVMVKREPGNPHDSNAVRINNVHGTQIGHIARDLAGKLAPYMVISKSMGLLVSNWQVIQDSRTLVVEGIIAGEKGQWDCPVLLKLYGPAEPAARAQLEAKMKSDRMPFKSRSYAPPKKPTPATAPPRKQTGFQSSQSGVSNSQPASIPELSVQDFITNSERFRPRDVQEIVEAWGIGEDALAKIPKAKQPERLAATLLPYQLQGLAWMLDKESPTLPAKGSKDIAQLWRRDPQRLSLFRNIATNYTTADAPTLARGGILADDMGLGKTLQVISLILEGIPGITLIMAPLSVMSNWVQQMERVSSPISLCCSGIY